MLNVTKCIICNNLVGANYPIEGIGINSPMLKSEYWRILLNYYNIKVTRDVFICDKCMSKVLSRLDNSNLQICRHTKLYKICSSCVNKNCSNCFINEFDEKKFRKLETIINEYPYEDILLNPIRAKEKIRERYSWYVKLNDNDFYHKI